MHGTGGLPAARVTPRDFIAKWSPGAPAHDLGERAGAQAHFIDLCRLLGVAEPGDPERYRFERGLTKTGMLPLVVAPVLYSYLVREKKPRPVPERGGAIPEGVAADRE